jgi:hypothetical protein
MQKLQKTIGNFDCPQIRSLTQLAETQSKRTLCLWSIDYAEAHLLPVFERKFPDDTRPREALANARGWLEGRVRFVDAKDTNNGAHNAATAAEGHPAAQAAARAIAHASLTIHVSAHCMGIAFYGAAALAYDQLGLHATQEEYLIIAQQAWLEMENALRTIAVENETNPAKLNWEFWNSRIR